MIERVALVVLGWCDALGLHGVAVDPAWLEHADITAASGNFATLRLLARGASFTALFAGNDTIAFGALKALREAKLRVPEDIAVMGYDDIPLAEFASPPPSTVQSDPIGHGEGAMAKLLEQMTGAALDPSALRELHTSRVIASRAARIADEQFDRCPLHREVASRRAAAAVAPA